MNSAILGSDRTGNKMEDFYLLFLLYILMDRAETLGYIDDKAVLLKDW